jgi:serine/threonine-protein kinase/endoribonuclease IRE1
MHFLIAASDFLEFEKPTAPAVIRMDSFLTEVVGPQNDWLLNLDPFLIDNLGQYRKYPLKKSVEYNCFYNNII